MTLKTQVFNTMSTVGISSNPCLEIQLITSLTVTFLLMQNFYQHSIFSANYHFLFFQKLCKRLTLSMHALIGSVGDGNISATVRIIVMKFHANILNRWLFVTQTKIMAIILYIFVVILTCLGGRRFFPGHCIITCYYAIRSSFITQGTGRVFCVLKCWVVWSAAGTRRYQVWSSKPQ